MINLQNAIEEAWKSYNDVSELEQSPLLQTAACQRLAWYPDDTYSVRALLRWHIDQLEAKGGRFANYAGAITWRYVQGKSNKAYAEEWWLDIRTAQNRVQRAREYSAGELAEKLTSAEIDPQQYPTLVRYEALNPNEQLSIQYLTQFQTPEPLAFLGNATEPAVALAISHLQTVRLLIKFQDGFGVHQMARDWLEQQIDKKDRQRWLAKIGRLYRDTDWPTAVYYFQQAEAWKDAAELLHEHREQLGKDTSLEVWHARMQTPYFGAVSSTKRIRLRLVHGQIAQLRDQLTIAKTAYEQAHAEVVARELHLETLYRLGHVHQTGDANRAIDYLNQLLQLAEQKGNRWCILGALLLAWIQMEQRDNLAEGVRLLSGISEEWLQSAELQYAAELRYQYHNTWAEYHRHNADNPTAYLHHAQVAYKASLETGNTINSLKAQLNLCLAYYECGQFDQARIEFERHYVMAKQAHMESLAAQNRNLFGNLLTNEYGAFAEAVPAYLEAAEYFRKTDDKRFLLGAMLGLIYAYSELSDVENARSVFAEAQLLASKLQHVRLTQALFDNEQQYPELTHNLNQHQIKALHYLRKHGVMANRHYQTLCNIGNRAANKHLKQMVSLGILTKEGKGAATQYRFPIFDALC